MAEQMQNKQRSLRPYLLSAQLTSPHGVMGACKIRMLGNDLERFKAIREAYLLSPNEEVLRKVKLQIRGEGKSYIAIFPDVNTREQAEQLRNCFIAFKREDAPALPEGRYYVCDLLNCTVYLAANGEELGRLKDILQNTIQDVYVVSRPGKKDLLFPCLPHTLVHVDIDVGEIHVVLPDGLLEIYE